MRLILGVIVIFVIFASFAYGEDLKTDEFTLTYNISQDRAPIGEEAEIKFEIKNNLNSAGRFRLKNTATDFDIRTSPLSVQLSGLKVFAGTTSDPFTLFLTPLEKTKVGPHEVVLDVKFEEGPISKLPVLIYVQPQSAAKARYKTSILVDPVFNSEFDPRNDFVMNINLDNLNKKPLDNVVINVKSNLIDETVTTNLKPLEKGKVTRIKRQFDPKLSPQADEILITILVDNESIKTFSKPLRVIDYTKDLIETVEIKNAFLIKSSDYKFDNNGNAVRSQTVKIPVGGIENIFTSTIPSANVITTANGDRFLSWDLQLNPGESTIINVKTSYQTPIVIILLLMVGFLYYYWTKSPVIVSKRAVNIGSKSSDISDIKINIHVRNPSRRSIQQVHIVDYVPSIAYVINEFKVGTLQPTKILKHEKRGDSLIKWELDQLDPQEDRILTYRIKTKLSIIGNISLPSVSVKYKKGKKNMVVKSNTLQIEA